MNKKKALPKQKKPLPDAIDLLDVNETFLSFQGEGPHTGVLAYFIRLNGCNFRCTWCDTQYTWGVVKNLVSIQELATKANETKARICVLTGGEPLMHEINTLMDLVTSIRAKTEIETNGFYDPGPLVWRAGFNISPKLSNSGMKVTPNYVNMLRKWASQPNVHCWKFVVGNEADVLEVNDLLQQVDIDPSKVWLMPMGPTREAQIATAASIAEFAKVQGYNLSLRAHSVIWNNKRGV